MTLIRKSDLSVIEISKSETSFFQEALLTWYWENGRTFPWRLKDTSLYIIIVSELLLQRTKAETVASIYPIFFSRYPDWNALADASEEDLVNIIKPIGLWKRRVVALQRLAHVMVENNGIFPQIRYDIENLPGVGQYIGNAIALFAYNEPQPLLDVNMTRVLERFFYPRGLVDIRYDPYLQYLSKTIVTCSSPREINWAIIDFASLVCKIKLPKCNECPLLVKCRYGNTPSK